MFVETRIPRRVVGAAFVLAAIAWSAGPVGAQSLSGTVSRQGSGTAGVDVELHRVTRQSAGVVGQATTDAAGRFRLPLPPADTAGFTVWFATAQYQGVRYFGAPLHPSDSFEGYAIAVFDTINVTAAAQAPRVQRRDIILVSDPMGSWEVNEVIQIHNPTQNTFVNSDGLPTWEFSIPAEATAFEAGDTEASASELARMDDRVLLLAPLLPGSREVYVRYRIPASMSALQVPVRSPTESLSIFISQPAPRVQVSGATAQAPIQADGRTFLRYDATDLEAGAVVSLAWTPTGPPVDPARAAMVVLGLILVLGAVAAVRRGGTAGGTRNTVEVARGMEEPEAAAQAPAEIGSS
jgi:hypothetical protein